MADIKLKIAQLVDLFSEEVLARLESRSIDCNQDGEQKKRVLAAMGKIDEIKLNLGSPDNSLESMQEYLQENEKTLNQTFATNRSETWFRNRLRDLRMRLIIFSTVTDSPNHF